MKNYVKYVSKLHRLTWYPCLPDTQDHNAAEHWHRSLSHRPTSSGSHCSAIQTPLIWTNLVHYFTAVLFSTKLWHRSWRTTLAVSFHLYPSHTRAATVLRPYCDQFFDQIALDRSKVSLRSYCGLSVVAVGRTSRRTVVLVVLVAVQSVCCRSALAQLVLWSQHSLYSRSTVAVHSCDSRSSADRLQ